MTIASARQKPSDRGAKPQTVADLLARLGAIPARRVHWEPLPGAATEHDLLKVNDEKLGLGELVDGTFVEKTMGYDGSELTVALIAYLAPFIKKHRLGVIAGADGPIRLRSGLVRLPDVSFIPRDRLSGGKRPRGPVPNLAPDLAVEVLSKGNTKREMARKLREYFDAGTRQVWLVDPRKKTVRVHSNVRDSMFLQHGDVLDGCDILPGFSLRLRDLFDSVE
jgi:Uma2 family endonuclease